MPNFHNLSTGELWLLAASICGCLYSILMLLRRPTTPDRRVPDFSFENAPDIDPTHGPESFERRSWVRREGKPISVQLLGPSGESSSRAAYVIDRSTGGLGIATPDRYAVGAVLMVRSTGAPADSPWVRIQVRTCTQVDDHYQLGCSFLEQPPWEILMRFG